MKAVRAVGATVLIGFLLLPMSVTAITSLGGSNLIQFPPQTWSLEPYRRVLTDPEWAEAIGNSFACACLATLLAATAGTAAALAASSEQTPSLIARAVTIAAIAPLLIPPIVLAAGGYGVWRIMSLDGSLVGLAIIHSLLGVPFVFLSVKAALAGLDRYLLMASTSLGANLGYSYRRVLIPTLLPSILTGAIFAFIASFDEIVIALFLLGGRISTLPLEVFSEVQFGVSPDLSAVTTIQVLIALALAAIVLAISRRGSRSVRVVSEGV